LSSVGEFFTAIEDAGRRHANGRPHIAEEDARAFDLFEKLRKRGKWPAKESVSQWFGQPHTQWRDRNGQYKRAVVRPHDAELLTRHEIQEHPPDLLITNYSMLEYMMMRPIERPIFDKTREWLDACPDEKMLVVLDEAHLYRGAQGAEVGLLLRRLRERLGIGPDRFQVICATASFSQEGQSTAGRFGAQLSGVPEDTFVPITGTLAIRTPEMPGTDADARALSAVDLGKFYSSSPKEQAAAAQAFLEYRNRRNDGDLSRALFDALSDFGPFNRLVNVTMTAAIPLAELGALVFPETDRGLADAATGGLLALGSRARLASDEPSLLPCRIHSFFRGLPGLWICMDPNCSQLPPEERGGPGGKLYAQPRERCGCDAPVLEYFTCRHCGTSYARAYTNDVADPRFVWANSGEKLQTDAGLFEAYQPLDLLLEDPSAPERGRAANYDLRTGRINPDHLSDKSRLIYLRPEAGGMPEDEEAEDGGAHPGEFAPCGCCRKSHIFGQSSVQDHQTKGDQPFQALLSTQIRVQPPGPQSATDFAPLRGRKVLVFSDSRQMAARLAPTLQSYSLKDTIRALLPVGFRILTADPQFGGLLTLDHAFLAVIVAAHRFGVRVRPELDSSETMPSIEGVPVGQVPTGPALIQLMSSRCPVNFMRAIVDVIRDNGLGLEPLAIASLSESTRLTSRVTGLPSVPSLAENEVAKLAVARFWLRCWVRASGIWLADMPPGWWTNEVRTHTGEFKAMERVLTSREMKRAFKNEWLPRLLPAFTQRPPDGGTRLLASNLSLDIGGSWRRCPTCKSIHRPIERVAVCVDCGTPGVEEFDPNTDQVFTARRGYYREPVAQALTQSEPSFISLIAAEHTAQLNAAQPEDIFSQAEKHEIRFQDIDLAWRDTDVREPAIDVLSSTTTMEVGIDIGELSGVALRNMPPARANYQQRSGRAGRRGTAVATVIAFGSSDSHDDHYFVSPDEMIRGPVKDARLTLENPDIARRHLRAYLLQRYHEARIPGVDPQADPNLFSVLGRVRDFRSGTGVLHREDFQRWLNENRADLEETVDHWLPQELSASDRAMLIGEMITDVVHAVDDAIGFVPNETRPSHDAADSEGAPADVGDADAALAEGTDFNEETEFVDPSADKLLDRLLYWGVLPRYAFPTDVAPFYVFNRALSTPFRPKMEFAPAQGLNIALSQYAPNKQIWIRGKQYTSKAIYSPYRNERRDAWGRRRLYFECSRCGHAKTEDYDESRRNTVVACEACRSAGTFGPAKSWFRPPGFAHPIDRDPVSTPDAPNETAYATRAKLVMPTPVPDNEWTMVGDRVRAFPTRKHLLVSNSGPDGEGYNYCVACGRIEAAADLDVNLFQPHTRPYPTDEDGPCPGRVANRVVLGTDFRTDIALFSLPLDSPFRVRPGNDETASALRTICEALAKAACRVLEIESGEILAEYRPALTDAGAAGFEAEIFVYDTLAGGAGFSPQLVGRSELLFKTALNILAECPEGCDASCYRCLRSFRNKLEHRLLDRKLGEQLLRHTLFGGYPAYPADRMNSSLDLLFSALKRQLSDTFTLQRSAIRRHAAGQGITVPIVVARRSNRQETWLALSSPIAPEVPADNDLRFVHEKDTARIICVDDLLIRRHLPAAVQQVQSSLR
jgi:MrfA Zn-binding domain/Helicase conserved C-terminal domain